MSKLSLVVCVCVVCGKLSNVNENPLKPQKSINYALHFVTQNATICLVFAGVACLLACLPGLLACRYREKHVDSSGLLAFLLLQHTTQFNFCC